MLVEVRKQRDLTQEGLAREVRVTLRTVQRWERNLGQPNATKLQAIAMALRVPLTRFFAAGDPQVAA